MTRFRPDAAALRGGGAWEVFETTPHYRRARLWLDGERYVVRTEYLAEDALLESNRRAYDDSAGKRWGDGQVVARIPLNRFFQSELAEKVREGDREHLRWWLDRDEARPYRTFKGRIS